MARNVGVVGLVLAGGAILFGGCSPNAANTTEQENQPAPVVEENVETTEAPAERDVQAPAPTASVDNAEATDGAPRPMEVGDCLNKVAVDDLGLPVPEYVDCSEPHMFEVTAIVKTGGNASFNFEAMDQDRDDRCRAAYESYTGRNAREVGNAFGWDQPTEAAWSAGISDYPCYATAPGFADLEGSVAR